MKRRRQLTSSGIYFDNTDIITSFIRKFSTDKFKGPRTDFLCAQDELYIEPIKRGFAFDLQA